MAKKRTTEFVGTREWLQTRTRIKEAERRLIYAALDCYGSVLNAANVARSDIEPIVVALRNPRVAVWDIGSRAIGDLARWHAAACEVFRELIVSRKAHDRSMAILSIRYGMPKKLAIELLTTGLNDRSGKIRFQAAMRSDIGKDWLPEMLPELDRRIEVESDAEVKGEIVYHADMIRVGYSIKVVNNHLTLWIRENNGWSLHSVTEDDIKHGRVPKLVAEARAKRMRS